MESLAIEQGDTSRLIEILPYWGKYELGLFLNSVYRSNFTESASDSLYRQYLLSIPAQSEERIITEYVLIINSDRTEVISISAKMLVHSNQTAEMLCQVLYDQSRTILADYRIQGEFISTGQKFSNLKLTKTDLTTLAGYDLCGLTLVSPVLPEIAVPAYIDLYYQLETDKSRWNGNFIYFLPLLNFIPTDSLTIQISGDKAFSWRISKDYSNQQEYEVNQSTDRSLIIDFNFLPSISNDDYDPQLIISSFTDFNEIARHYHQFFSYSDPSPAIREKINSLAYAKTPLDAAAEIYYFVSNNISYIALEWGWNAYYSTPPELTLSYGYGDCKDQVELLITMLKSININCWPILISTRESSDICLDPPAANFNHLIVGMEIQGDTYWADPTHPYLKFGDLPLADRTRKGLLLSGYNNSTLIDIPGEIHPSGYYRNLRGNLNENGGMEVVVNDSVFGFLSSTYRAELVDNPYPKISAWFSRKLPSWEQRASWYDFPEMGTVTLGGRFYFHYNLQQLNLLNLPLMEIDLPYPSQHYTQGPLTYKIEMNFIFPEKITFSPPENYHYLDENLRVEYTYSIYEDSFIITHYAEILNDTVRGSINDYIQGLILTELLSQRPLVLW
ncbi:MAG: transglutaminase-like domain-containing protein [bacterium]